MKIDRAIAGALFMLAAAAPLPTERIVSGDGAVAATIDDVAGRMRLDPGATGMPILTTAFAERAGLKPGVFGVGFLVGRERLNGRTALARIGFGGQVEKHRVAWIDRPYAAGFDGVAGPGGIPDPIVRFVLRAAVPGERTVSLPMVDSGGLGGGWGGLFARIAIGSDNLRIRFDPFHAHTLANAGAGVRIAAAHGGRLSGEPRREEIAFGIERPVRTMQLAVPLTIGPLSIATLGVRTADIGSTAAISDADADPEEVVVVAKGKPREGRVSIGADSLTRCSSIVFDKPAKTIRLTCAG